MSHKACFKWASPAFLLLAIGMVNTTANALPECATATPLSSIALTPPSGNFGGTTQATLTLTFSAALPADCDTWVRFSSSNFEAASPKGLNEFRGAGPHTTSVSTLAVNQPTTVTISALSVKLPGPLPGGPGTQTATMTLQPLPLISFSIDKPTIQRNETATGRVELGGVGFGGVIGLARVDLTADPAAAVTIPAFIDVGNQSTPAPGGGLTEHVSTFAVTARGVTEPTNVTITASRAGVTRTDTIRVLPGLCRVRAQLISAEVGGQDAIRAIVKNVGTGQCPGTTMGMRMFIGPTATGFSTNLQGLGVLTPLGPNVQVDTHFVWQPVPFSGPRTFQLFFGADYPGIAAADPSLILHLTAEQVDRAAAD